MSYGPNRTVDSNYYSFAYTRLQEQDWAEVFIHARKKHVDAAVGWMGYWFQSVGFRNYDAAWAPGLAYVALDTDFGDGDLKQNIAFTAGAFWPSFGYFEKYDTYTLGRFRQLGAQLKLTAPLSPDVTVTPRARFRDRPGRHLQPWGPAILWSQNGHRFACLRKRQGQLREDSGLWSSHQHLVDRRSRTWRRNQRRIPSPLRWSRQAHLSVAGAEVNVRVPQLGHLWLSPSFISVRNGWALNNAGTEVMHSLSGAGIATNYMAWTNNPNNSTGSGSMINLGFLYENTLSGVQGRAPGGVPEVTMSIFGLLADASLNLPAGTDVRQPGSNTPQTSIKQFKYGADVTLQSTTWLAFMLRYDGVNYDLDHPGYVFATVTPRVIVSSHFLSSERIYLQYSRYFYGDNMVLAGQWPWGAPLVAGSDVLQAGPYSGMTPDVNVVKLQADVAF